jgi:ATP synthase protein I
VAQFTAPDRIAPAALTDFGRVTMVRRASVILPLVRVPRMSEGRPPDPLARLGEEIDKARAERVRSQPVVQDRSVLQQGLSLGFRIGIELVVAVVVATGLGWAIDHWLGNRVPWAMIVLFFLGVAAGMLNVYRAVTGIGGAAGYRRRGPDAGSAPSRLDDEDC